MRRRDIVLVVGLLTAAACLDRKSKNLDDGAVGNDALAGEIAPPSGGHGGSALDGPASPDAWQPLDGAGTPDVPITNSDAGTG